MFLPGLGEGSRGRLPPVRALPHPRPNSTRPGLGPPPASTSCAWESAPTACGQLSSFPALSRPLQPTDGTTTYSVGEGKYWKSGDLQFLQKRNSLAKSLPVLVL